MGLSLPSKLTEKPYAMGLPSALTPSNEYFTPSPCASTVRVKLLYPGPGSNFDFATLSFHVPTSGLVWARRVEKPAVAKKEIATNRKARFMGDPPWVRPFVILLAVFVGCWKLLGLDGPWGIARATIGRITVQVNISSAAAGKPSVDSAGLFSGAG